MCLLIIAYKVHPEYPFIVAANRDEYYSRPAESMHFWKNYPHLLAGKDLKAGGTWMGITRNGRFAAITNYRNPAGLKQNAPSRGKLVLKFLVDSISPKEFIRNLKNPDKYNGFNLIFGSINSLYYYSNVNNQIQEIMPGIHGVSNALLNTPWYKVRKACSYVEELITNEDSIKPDSFLTLLTDTQVSPENELPDTGIGKGLELKLSPIFISTEKYGTRCSTVLILNKKNIITVKERNYNRWGDFTQEISFSFQIEPIA